MNTRNITDRITLGLECIDPPLCLLAVASEATSAALTTASPAKLERWAADVLQAANELQGQAGQYWASVAAELRSLAWERHTQGVGE